MFSLVHDVKVNLSDVVFCIELLIKRREKQYQEERISNTFCLGGVHPVKICI